MTPQVIFLEDISVTNFSLSDKYSDNEKIVTNISVTMCDWDFNMDDIWETHLWPLVRRCAGLVKMQPLP